MINNTENKSYFTLKADFLKLISLIQHKNYE